MGAEVLIPAGMGLLGTLMGSEENRKNRNAMNDANAAKNALIGRQTDLFDQIRGIVMRAQQSGQFDPNKRIAQMDADVNRAQKNDLNALSGAMKVSGYKPGDSEIATRQGAVQASYKAKRAALANDIRNNSFREQLEAFRAIDPTSLNPGISAAQNDYMNARSSMVNPASGLMAMMSAIPFGQKGGSQPSWAYYTDPNGVVKPLDKFGPFYG
jgi:hypothetical protein